jgi:phenylpyruvate tautomerase PptA (4-oxalocrotonate tautomerase family)
MPIIDVEIVEHPSIGIPNNLANVLARRIGEVFQAASGSVWVKLYRLPFADYAESDGNPNSIAPVFVNVLMRMPLPLPLQGEALATTMRELTVAIAEVCERPIENVHVLFAPSARGRQAFGGKLVQ